MEHPLRENIDPSRPPLDARLGPHARRWHKEADHFRNYIDHGLGDHTHRGTNGSGQEVYIVCKKALTEYWTPERIAAVLDRDDNREAHIRVIENPCLVIFSILCYISCSDYFNQFSRRLRLIDDGLPAFESHYPNIDPDLRAVLKRFCEAQWKFIPLDFEPIIHYKELAAEYILPVVYDRVPLATSDGSAVYRVLFEPCCVGRGFRSDANSEHVVFKMLSPDESEVWENEVYAYNLLSRSSPNERRLCEAVTHMGSSQAVTVASSFNHITRYLGSFIIRTPEKSRRERDHLTQDGSHQVIRDVLEKTHVIVLEYARGGNLTNFCRRNINLVTSSDREDRLDFWHQMFHLLQALHVIHSANGTHQDIKDSNVLCMCEDGPFHNRNKAVFKLSDLEKCHFKRDGGAGVETKDINKRGNRIYTNDIEQAVPRPYTKAADIWSLGCLFSNMLVRSSLGEKGVESYREARKAENINRGTAVAPHSPQCFHDGVNRLSCVKDFHRKALEQCPGDDVLRAVSDIILDYMLRPLAERTDDALTLRVLWMNRVDPTSRPTRPDTEDAGALKPAEASSSSAPARPPPPPPQETTISADLGTRPYTSRSLISARSSRPDITVQHIISHLRRPQKLRLLLQPGAKLDATFPGLLSALSVAKERNHHFLVDSSKTMETHQDTAADTVWALSKLLKSKPPRPGSIKMSILGDIKQAVYLLHASTKQAHIIRRFRFDDSRGWLLGVWLQRIASEIMDGLSKGPSRSVSLYILTDGQFEGKPPEFARPIHGLLEKVGATQNVGPSFLSITIIRFGDDADAHQQLEDLRQSVSNLDNLPPAFNPICICSLDGDVADMLIGSIRESTTNVSTRGMERRATTAVRPVPRG